MNDYKQLQSYGAMKVALTDYKHWLEKHDASNINEINEGNIAWAIQLKEYVDVVKSFLSRAGNNIPASSILMYWNNTYPKSSRIIGLLDARESHRSSVISNMHPDVGKLYWRMDKIELSLNSIEKKLSDQEEELKRLKLWK